MTNLARAHLLARLAGVAGAAIFLLVAPAAVAAHQLSSTYTSRLPLAAYLAGAAATVALSFIFVLARDLRAQPDLDDGRRLTVPAWLRLLFRAVGLLAWAWIVVQGVIGGSSDAEVAHLFLWVYGWVGVAIVSALIGPAWRWLDPFATLHDIGAWLLARLGIRGIAPIAYPDRLGRWPAAIGFAGFVWLELVLGGGGDGMLFIVLMGYTAYTLAMMAQFGRDAWRANGETFSAWFGLLGRMAPFVIDDAGDEDWIDDRAADEGGGWDQPDDVLRAQDRRLRRRGFGTGLLEPGWQAADAALIGLGVGSILFDGLSQTQIWFDTFGAPTTLAQTGLLFAFLLLVLGAVASAVRAVGVASTGAALLPIAVGYLVAHYLTYLLIDGQRIVVALADPFQQGWALLPTAFHEPNADFLPAGLVWTLQLAAVVGGHMLGAWGGHVVAARDGGPAGRRDPRLREIPLAIVMVGLTTLTLWSLGQAIVQPM